MRTIVVSGSVGAGKSTVGHLLTEKLVRHVLWFSADACVKGIYGDPAQRKVLIEAFGDALGADVKAAMLSEESGSGLKEWLRENILPVQERRKELEAWLHPYVLKSLEEIRQNGGGNLLVAEVPLHYEIGQVIPADLVIVVAASRSVQVRRMMENRALDEATAQAFLNAQWPIETKVEKADVVIWNDGDPSALECQTLLLANLLNLE